MPAVHRRIGSLNKERFAVHTLESLVPCRVLALFSDVFTFYQQVVLAVRIWTYRIIRGSWTGHGVHHVCMCRSTIYYLLLSRSLPSLSGAEDDVGHGDVSPYFITNCTNLTDIANPIIYGNAPGFSDGAVISIKHPGKHVGAP